MAGSPAQASAGEDTALDRELDESLAAFDETLSQRREDLEKAAAEQQVARATTGGATTASKPAFGGQDAESESALPTSSGAGYTPGTEPAGRASSPEQQTRSSGAAPGDIPSDQDDDIVARQIREAAQSETDPKLREKLWEEYRRYKQGGGA